MKATEQELIEALKTSYEYISKLDAVYFLSDLFQHRGNGINDYVKAWRKAY